MVVNSPIFRKAKLLFVQKLKLDFGINMKLFFISDIHGSISSLRTALDFFESERADRIIVLGDSLYHGPRNPLPEDYSPAEVAALLNCYKDKIIAVRGNCDSEVDQMLIEYPMMETSSTVLLNDRKMFLTHGHIYNPENLPHLSSGDIFAFGHIHLPVAEKQGEVYIFNPGSITLPKGGNPKSYGIYDGNNLSVKSFDGAILAEIKID